MTESLSGKPCLRASYLCHDAPRRRRLGIAISACLASLAALAPTLSRADSTWTGAVDTNFNNPLNWVGGVPGSSDRAIYPATVTADSVLAATQTGVAALVFGPGSAATTLNVTAASGSSAQFAVGAGGILNNGSGTASIVLLTSSTGLSLSGPQATIQGHVAITASTFNSGIDFMNGASAGSATLFATLGSIEFHDTSSAGSANVQVGSGATALFHDSSSAGHALFTLTGGADVLFEDIASAASSRIVVKDGALVFLGSASAAQASISNLSLTIFGNLAGAGTAQIVNAGTLSFRDSASAGASTITNQSGASLTFASSANAASATVANLAGATLDASGVTAARLAIGSLSGAGAVLLGATTLVEGGLNQDDTIAGTLSGAQGSLVKTGSGTLTLAGSNTYGGTTRVASGVLALDGTITGAALVANGAALSGHGSTGASVALQTGATLLANEPGTGLKIAGDLTFAQGAKLVSSLDGGKAGLTTVGGALTVAGADLDVVATGASAQYRAGSIYRIATAQGGVAGHFALATTNLTSLTPEVIYDPNAIEVLFEPVTIHGGGPGGGSTASGANGVPGLPTLLAPLGPDALGRALSTLSGTQYPLLRELELVAADGFAREVADRAQLPFAPDVSLDLVGSEARVKADGQAAGADLGTTGLWAALSLARGSGWDLATALRIERGRLDFTDGDAATGRFDRTDLGLVARGRLGAAELSGIVSGGAHSDVINRGIEWPGFASSVGSRTSGSDATLLARVDWPLEVGTGRLSPFAEAGATSLHWGSFEEGGSARVDLEGQGRHATVPFDEVGVSIASGEQLPTHMNAPPYLRASLGWFHEAAGTAPPMEVRFVGDASSTSFPVAGAPLGHDFANATLTAIFPLRFGVQLELRARAQTNDQFRELDGYAGLHLDW